MKNSSLPFSRKLTLLGLLAMAGALAFVSPWGVLAAVVVAVALLFWPVTNTSGELGRIDTLLQKFGDGEMVGRLPNVMADPTLESIRVNLNSVLDQTETAFREILGALQASTSGNVARRLQLPGLHGTFRTVLERMQVILDHLAEAQESVAREALLSQIFLRSERGLSLAIEHVDTALNNVGSNSRTSRELAANFGRSASAMSDAARRMSDALGGAQEAAEGGVHALADLNAKASDIQSLTTRIDGVAKQTNLLALNAAIEAARAGDAGRGFAVVADEVRKLAEKTMISTHDVGNAIKAIQESTATSMAAMGTAAAQVNQATEFANQSGQALGEIVITVEGAADQVNAIAAASEQQSVASDEINRSISTVNEAVQQTALAMSEASRAVGELRLQTGTLTSLIAEIRNEE